MEAEVSGDKLTEGIHQDGTDYSYFLQAQFGSKGKELYLLVDTGAGSSWVMGSNCNSEACSLHDSFGVEDSDTFKASSEVFSVEYGSGEVEGHLATDTIQLGGMSFDFQFGVAEKTSKDFVHFAFDGILGLSMNKGANENFLQTMEDSGDLDANVFGVSLHRASDGTNDGEIQFGSVNSDRYQGDITYTPLKAEGDDWAIKLDDITYDGKSANAQGVHAYIDTGTTFIFAPEAAAKAFHDLIPGAKSSDGMYYKVPCDSKAPLIFTFSGKEIEVSSKDWISPEDSEGLCTSNIYGWEVVEGSWLLGATFIKNVYTVFDKDKRRIGFAQPSDDSSSPEPTSTETETTMTSPPVSTETDSESTKTEKNSASRTLGLGGQESVKPTKESDKDGDDENTEEGGDDKKENDKSSDDSGTSSLIMGSPKVAFSVCIATVFALLV